MDDLSKMCVGDVVVEGRNRDGDQVQCGEGVQGGNESILGLEGRKGPSDRDGLKDENSDEVEEKNELDEANLWLRREMKTCVMEGIRIHTRDQKRGPSIGSPGATSSGVVTLNGSYSCSPSGPWSLIFPSCFTAARFIVALIAAATAKVMDAGSW